MAEELKYDVENFKMNPCAVEQAGTLLGGTDGPVNISSEVEYYESTCNQAGAMVIAKRITKIKYTIKAKFKEINKALAAVLGETKEITTALIGKNIFEEGKPLVLSEIGEGATNVHTFPKAVALKEMSYDIDGTNEHGIEVTFEAIADESGMIYKVTSAA